MLEHCVAAVKRALQVAIYDCLDLFDRLLSEGNVLNDGRIIDEGLDGAAFLQRVYASTD